MSSEVHKYKEKVLEKNQNLFYGEVINFPNEKKASDLKHLKINTNNFWEINDKSNNDQLKAVIGICFMFGSLVLMGLYSNLS
tara:strand:- start:63 stop:308 length:246 start_codon:yes stop_codon:yes gene_type:complete